MLFRDSYWLFILADFIVLIDVYRCDLSTSLNEYMDMDMDLSWHVVESCSIYVEQFLPRDASAERGDEIACRLSVRLSVCNV